MIILNEAVTVDYKEMGKMKLSPKKAKPEDPYRDTYREYMTFLTRGYDERHQMDLNCDIRMNPESDYNNQAPAVYLHFILNCKIGTAEVEFTSKSGDYTIGLEDDEGSQYYVAEYNPSSIKDITRDIEQCVSNMRADLEGSKLAKNIKDNIEDGFGKSNVTYKFKY